MKRLETTDPTTYLLDAEGLDHLDALVKLLERSREGMTPEEVRRATESMKRLRQALVKTAVRGPDSPEV